MILLPSFSGKIIPRPGNYAGGQKHFVPDSSHLSFWRDWYNQIAKAGVIHMPVKSGVEHIDPFFGYFGFRYHPVNFTPEYFHLGLDIVGRSRKAVTPIADGVLEYSGYGHVNGNYVMLSHPEITTVDGYVMHSLYLHLRCCSVKFSARQKMLREISLHTYPQVKIAESDKIGEIGNSGNGQHAPAHLHLQIEFRNKEGNIVVVDPALVLGLPSHYNRAAHVRNEQQFLVFRKKHTDELGSWESFWKHHDKDMR